MARQLTVAGIPTQVSDNVRGALWAKLVLNSAYNALSALSPKRESITGIVSPYLREAGAAEGTDGATPGRRRLGRRDGAGVV